MWLHLICMGTYHVRNLVASDIANSDRPAYAVCVEWREADDRDFLALSHAGRAEVSGDHPYGEGV